MKMIIAISLYLIKKSDAAWREKISETLMFLV